jgi:hypothetical protein
VKRGGNLTRKTELKAKKGLTRGRPMKRSEFLAKPGLGLPMDSTPADVDTSGSSDREWGLAKRKPLARAGRIKPVSSKRAKENRVRSKVLAELAEQDPWCFARIEGVCTGLACDGHELTRRSQGGSIVDPKGIELACRACHEWIGRWPEKAVALGLARWGMRTNPETGEVA